MNYEALRTMDVQELVRAITLDRADFDEGFLVETAKELARRRVELADYTDQVTVAASGEPERESTAPQAIAELEQDGDVWEFAVYTTCLGDSLVVQKEIRRWVCHCYEDGAYSGSTFTADLDSTRAVLSSFLRLDADALDAVEWQDLDVWSEAAASSSRRYTARAAADLDGEGIPYTVRPPSFTDGSDESYSVLVRPEDAEAALVVVEGIRRKVLALCEQAARLSDGPDRERELELYDLLCDLAPETPAVHYNRGSVLLELERWDAAAAALAEALQLAIDSLRDPSSWQAKQQARPGGFVGLAAWLLGRKPPEMAAQPKYPDYVDDIEMLFERIHQQVAENTAAMHGLATISQLRDDPSALAEWSRRILDIDPDDEAARINLNYAENSIGTAEEEGTQQR